MTDAVFIHIPKTGGRSVLKAMGLPFRTQHLTLAELETNNPGIASPKVFRFATVRNPWDRLASMWLFFGHMVTPDQLKPFGDWLINRARQAKACPKFPIRPSVNQIRFCKNSSGDLGVSEFLRFENLEEGYRNLALRVGLPPELPKIGTRERFSPCFGLSKPQAEERARIAADYRSGYTSQEMVDAVAFMDSEVIDLFGYSFK